MEKKNHPKYCWFLFWISLFLLTYFFFLNLDMILNFAIISCHSEFKMLLGLGQRNSYIDICLFWWVGVAAYTEWSLSSVTECTMQFRNIQVLLSNLEDVAYDQHNSDCKRESFYFILSSKWCCCLYLNGLMHFTPFLSATILRLTGLFRVPQLWILNHNLKIKYFRACHYNG